MSAKRFLFASVHSYIDPSSGAALATRDLLELLAARSWDCRALSCGLLDYEEETPLEDVLAALEQPACQVAAALSRGGQAEVFDLELERVRVTLLPTSSSRAGRSPSPREGAIFLELVGQVLERFRPNALLTYGGHPVSLELMRRARQRKIPVVFHLHNFSYTDRRGFDDASAVLVPTECAQRHYARRLGLECTHIPLPLNPRRVIATEREPTYVTFVNPQRAKGAAMVARIVLETDKRRPDIPFLVVESRARTDELGGLGLDLSRVENLHRMSNTTDPRDFYRVSRVMLVPSLIENAALVAREALANGIPVLASDRGGLPETLGESGFLFALPDRLTPAASGPVPTARDVAPWIATIEKLWDDPEFEDRHRALALAEALRRGADRLGDEYERFFALGGGGFDSEDTPPNIPARDGQQGVAAP
jgi:glycosyltransferase involved in cell wall biosynthesis